jgi:hypothetical protein
MSGGFDRGMVMLVAAPIAIFIIAMIGMVLKIGVLKLLAFIVVSLADHCLHYGHVPVLPVHATGFLDVPSTHLPLVCGQMSESPGGRSYP